jgi:hypothetical protein
MEAKSTPPPDTKNSLSTSPLAQNLLQLQTKQKLILLPDSSSVLVTIPLPLEQARLITLEFQNMGSKKNENGNYILSLNIAQLTLAETLKKQLTAQLLHYSEKRIRFLLTTLELEIVAFSDSGITCLPKGTPPSEELQELAEAIQNSLGGIADKLMIESGLITNLLLRKLDIVDAKPLQVESIRKFKIMGMEFTYDPGDPEMMEATLLDTVDSIQKKAQALRDKYADWGIRVEVFESSSETLSKLVLSGPKSVLLAIGNIGEGDAKISAKKEILDAARIYSLYSTIKKHLTTIDLQLTEDGLCSVISGKKYKLTASKEDALVMYHASIYVKIRALLETLSPRFHITDKEHLSVKVLATNLSLAPEQEAAKLETCLKQFWPQDAKTISVKVQTQFSSAERDELQMIVAGPPVMREMLLLISKGLEYESAKLNTSPIPKLRIPIAFEPIPNPEQPGMIPLLYQSISQFDNEKLAEQAKKRCQDILSNWQMNTRLVTDEKTPGKKFYRIEVSIPEMDGYAQRAKIFAAACEQTAQRKKNLQQAEMDSAQKILEKIFSQCDLPGNPGEVKEKDLKDIAINIVGFFAETKEKKEKLPESTAQTSPSAPIPTAVAK